MPGAGVIVDDPFLSGRRGMIACTGFRHCPRCGSTGITEAGRNALQCRECGFCYYHNCAAAVAAIIETGRGIVLIRRAREPKEGLQDLPGGFVDYGETLEAAICREVREEIGLGVEHLRYFGSFPNRYVHGDVTYFTTDAVFLCSFPEQSLLPRPSDEVGEVEIVDPRLIDPALIAFDSIRAALIAYRESLRR